MRVPDANYRSNWDESCTSRFCRFNEYFYDVYSGFADNLDSDQLAIRTAEVRFMRAFAYQELVLRHGGVTCVSTKIEWMIITSVQKLVRQKKIAGLLSLTNMKKRPNPTGRMDRIGGRPPYKGGCLWYESPCRSLRQALAGCC